VFNIQNSSKTEMMKLKPVMNIVKKTDKKNKYCLLKIVEDFSTEDNSLVSVLFLVLKFYSLHFPKFIVFLFN